MWSKLKIAWAVADGGNVISPLKEMIFYGGTYITFLGFPPFEVFLLNTRSYISIPTGTHAPTVLDLVAKPVFCFYHAYQISKVPYERFLSSGKASTGAGGVLPGTFVNGQYANGQVGPKPVAPMAQASNGHANGYTNGQVNGNGNGSGGIGGITGVPVEGASYGIGNGVATAPGSLSAREGMARRVSGRGAAEAQ